MTHTPGPWTITDHGGVGTEIRSSHALAQIATVYGRAADAHLIAAAPELLAALLETLDILDGYTQGDHTGRPWLYRAKAAITKATKGTQ